MPEFLERKLDKEYPNEPTAKYKIMNKIGAMHGNKETKKGERMEAKHEKKMKGRSIQNTLDKHRK